MAPNTIPLDFGLVPPHRLGQLLKETRARFGLDLSTVRERVSGHFDLEELAAVEAGHRYLDDAQLAELSVAYGVPLGDVVPQRSQLIIDLEEGRMHIGRDRKRFNPEESPRHVMLRYLALITALRTEPTRQFPLRDDDVYTLGTALRTGPGLIRRELEHLMTTAPKEVEVLSSSLGRRLAVPAIGLLVAITAAGGLLLVKAHADDGPAPTTLAPAASVSR